MEEITLSNVLWFIGTMLVGFFIKTIWDRITALSQRVESWASLLPETYVRRDDYREDIRDIKDMLAKIFDRLETKADK